jgi:peptidoglycan glycosyltransferase
VNERIVQVFGGIVAAFVAIIALLTFWQVLDAPSLRDKHENRQSAWYEQRIKRGSISTADGLVVAGSVARHTRNGDEIWVRTYPRRGLAANVVGYSTQGRQRTGIERTYNEQLTGSDRSLAGVVGKLKGDTTVVGDSVRLTIDSRAQRTAQLALAGTSGAVVALQPKTGRVLVLASSPDFDPNRIDTDYASVAKAPGAPLLDRATQAHYPPGSTFKLVTAAAALEAGIVTPTTHFDGGCSTKVKSGPPVSNAAGECPGGHDLRYALTHSINTTFAKIGDELGAQRLREQMAKFGFGSAGSTWGAADGRLLEDLPQGEVAASGLFGASSALLPADQGVDAARVAIGQERLLATPLQMAVVAATIANGGIALRPRLVDRVVDSGGHVVSRSHRTPLTKDPAISPETAAALTSMMQDVVKEGTGTAAAMRGIDVAGKTGTADTSHGNQVWFVAFAPADDPEVAIAVTLESQSSGIFGGTIAAPIAHDVMLQLLRHRAELKDQQ